VSVNFALGQGLEEFILTVKFGHLYIGIADFIMGMGITAGTLGNIMLLSKCQSFSRIGRERASGVKYFHNVDLPRYLLYYLTV